MHQWKFHRIGGLDQVSLNSGADLAALAELDQKLWVALSCPARGLELDNRTLELLDIDKDGRVRSPEILAAIRWCVPRLRDLQELIPSADGLALSAIHDGTPEGRALFGAMKRILAHRRKSDTEVLTCADVADVSQVFQGSRLNGDGVITPESPDDPALGQIIAEAAECVGAVSDRSGTQGIDAAKLEQFFAELQSYADWSAQASSGMFTLGDQTAAGYEAVQAVRTKVDDYFNRCRIAAFEPRAGPAVNRAEAELAALARMDLSTTGDELKSLPLAHVEVGAPLPLLERTNPAWSGALQALHRSAIVPIFGPEKTDLSEVEWKQVQPGFAAYEGWIASKKGSAVERLGLARVQEILASEAKSRLAALIAEDEALRPEAEAISDAVRIVHYKRDLHTLLKNFVNFADFYDMRTQAIFQAGTLYLDSRSCDLCVRVDDPSAHAALASLSYIYVAYCDLRRPGETMKIAAGFTQGDSDYLRVGRNGIFYDRKGRDWDATIVKIVENPISIRQAFFAPYKRFLRLINEQVQKFAEAKEKESDARLKAAAEAGTAPSTAPGPVDVGKMVGIIAALGVGVGAVGTLFGGFVSGFIGLQPWWAKPVAVLGALLAVSGPSMLLAWLKLRQRTLGPVLEANGWAVNGRVKVNIPLGAALTELCRLPPGSSRSLKDPFVDKKARRRRRLTYAALVLLAAAAVAARYFRLWIFAG